ncbi:MAG: O-methyltransferase [Acidimicrobiaceae bacterium]|nr:O-methyltransferase [Acidimicrobiaceae bacterium]
MSPVEVAERPGPGASPAALYLDLLKRCLTRFDFDPDLAPIVPGTPLKRRLWAQVATLLGRRDIVAFRRAPYESWRRQEGRDWPISAETMVGLRRLDNLQACIESVVGDSVPGDVLEAGVWRGGAAILMRAVLASLQETGRTVWVADSFQGLPKPKDEHLADRDDLHWSQPFLAVSQDEVKQNFTRYGMLDRQVRFLAGWFSDTLADAPIERLAVLRVDCDMYGSTIDVLSALYPKVSIGGYAIVDDYGEIPNCRAAVDDYRAQHHITEPIRWIDGSGIFWRRQS